MIAYRANWILPIHSEPIPDGVVVVEDGVVSGLGPADEMLGHFPQAELHELGEAVVLPALVNAHTHLALTHHAGLHPAGEGLFAWLKSIVPHTRVMDDAAVQASVRAGIEESWLLGTGIVGDIVTHPAVTPVLRSDGRLRVRAFYEFLGLTEASCRRSLQAAQEAVDAAPGEPRARFRPGLSPHAPYSVWTPIWKEAVTWANGRGIPWATHLLEAASEPLFTARAQGEIREYLEWLGVWDDGFPPMGQRPISFFDRTGILGPGALFVHGVHLVPDEMNRLNLNDIALCLCPRSNAYLGLPPVPMTRLREAGVFLCLGTDSKASNHDLGLWGEMRAIRNLAEDLPAGDILAMATAHGAMALGFRGEAGLIAPGVEADLLAVETPGLGDGSPEEHLVREVVEDRLRRLSMVRGNASG